MPSFIHRRWNAILVIAALGALMGCQGLSTGKTTASQQPGVLGVGSISITFGNVQMGTTQSKTNSVTNSGGTSITVTSAKVTGTSFSVSNLTMPLTLAPGQSASFDIVFGPKTTGAITGALALTADTGSVSVALAGTGAAANGLSTSPTSFSFGNIQVNSTSIQTETLKNVSTNNLTVTAASMNGATFSYSGLTLPLTLAPGQSSPFSVKFAPTQVGTGYGTLSLTVSGSADTVDISMNGTGVGPALLTATPTSLTFSGITVGQSSMQTETIKNTGGTSVSISAVAASGTGFSVSGITTPVTLTAGQSTSFSVTFAPASTTTSSGAVTVTSNASNPSLAVPLSGTAVAAGDMTATPTSVTFTNITVGQSSSQTQTIKNNGGTSVKVTAVAATGTGFSVSGITLPVTLTAGQSTSFTVGFAPQTAGNFTGNVAVTSNASNPTMNIPLSGSSVAVAAGTLGVSPNPVPVGSVTMGSSGTATGTLSASGGSVKVTAVSVGGTNGSEFTVTGLTLPATIASGSSLHFTVTFTPTATGSASGTATFTSNASNSPSSTGLTGTGTAASSHSVSLSWTASTSTGVTGYNVYRAPFTSACGTYTKINSALVTTTSYTDSTVANGNTYCYVTTSMNSSDEESDYSSVVQSTIPAN